MPEYFIIWTTEIIDHLADNAVSQDDFEYVVLGASVFQEETKSVEREHVLLWLC